MKAIIKPIFEIDVTDWYEGEGLTKSQKVRKIKEELSDFSVFMPLANYENMLDVKVEIL